MTDTLQNISYKVAIGLMALALLPQVIFAYDAGNDAITRPNVDSYSNFTIVDTNKSFDAAGDVIEFEYYAENSNPFRIVIVDETNQVEWVSHEITPTADAVGIFEPNPLVPVEAGWNLAVYSASTGVIPFSGSGAPAAYEDNNAGLPVLGELLTIVGTDGRYYSLNATLDADSDGDSVMDSADLCNGTGADVFPKYGDKTAKNRWTLVENLGGTFTWKTNAKSGTMGGFTPTIEDTKGCSGEQILEILEDKTGLDYGGEKKFGITKGTLELWMSGVYYAGKTLIDTVVVDSADFTGESSTEVLDDANDYFLAVSGTWTNRPGEVVDAEYSNFNGLGWFDAPNGGYPANLLDLQVNSTFVDWGTQSLTNNYEIAYTPTSDGTVNFRVFDHGDINAEPDGSWYVDNVGTLTVTIYEDLYIDLW